MEAGYKMKCIILAGDSGNRLWPLSGELSPKSLLTLFGKKTLLQNAYELALMFSAEKNIITVTNIRQYDETKQQLSAIADKPVIISEPMSKDTTAAIATAITFAESEKDEIVLILPVDFSVKNKDAFKSAVLSAKFAAKKEYITMLGVKSTHFEPGFGYFKTGELLGNKCKETVQYKENLNDEDSEEYSENENILCNTGIYISKVSVLKEAFKRYVSPGFFGFSKNMFDSNNKTDYKYYEKLPEIPFSEAVIQKATNLAAVELDANWSDYGSWGAIYNKEKKDNKGNITKGNVLIDKVKDSLIYSSKELVAASGLKDTVIVETEDAILVCDRSRTSDINKITDELKKENNSGIYSKRTVFRPWGYYTTLSTGKNWLTRIITVAPGHKLSMQSHEQRSEHWVVLEGTATVMIEEETMQLEKRHSINIPINTKHSLLNKNGTHLKILEVQRGEYIGEDDITRYEDEYGRIKTSKY